MTAVTTTVAIKLGAPDTLETLTRYNLQDITETHIFPDYKAGEGYVHLILHDGFVWGSPAFMGAEALALVTRLSGRPCPIVNP